MTHDQWLESESDYLAYGNSRADVHDRIDALESYYSAIGFNVRRFSEEVMWKEHPQIITDKEGNKYDFH
jgi:hypothetical protein